VPETTGVASSTPTNRVTLVCFLTLLNDSSGSVSRASYTIRHKDPTLTEGQMSEQTEVVQGYRVTCLLINKG
jgi:hypothetical protein